MAGVTEGRLDRWQGRDTEHYEQASYKFSLGSGKPQCLQTLTPLTHGKWVKWNKQKSKTKAQGKEECRGLKGLNGQGFEIRGTSLLERYSPHPPWAEWTADECRCERGMRTPWGAVQSSIVVLCITNPCSRAENTTHPFMVLHKDKFNDGHTCYDFRSSISMCSGCWGDDSHCPDLIIMPVISPKAGAVAFVSNSLNETNAQRKSV